MSKFTLGEAIKHCLEVAEQNETQADKIGRQLIGSAIDKYATDCRECAAEHRQLAEWLTDYKELKNSIGAVKLGNMKEALALIRTLKAELNGWRENPFGIIEEVCELVSDCRRCRWYEKCPFRQNYGSYPKDWRNENAE